MNPTTNLYPLVTIAVPTYQRADLLRRALLSISKQSYLNLEVIIADNCSHGDENQKIAFELKKQLPQLIYKKHDKNIGAINNFFYCLRQANGELFMWLADDDEITDSSYIQELVNIHNSNPNASTALANCKLMNSLESGKIIPMRDYKSKFWFLRVLKFTWYSFDDFFYGLHKTDMLRKATKVDYWSINKDILTNWAYPFLLDMIIQGPVVGTQNGDIIWLNHDYTNKAYKRKHNQTKIVIFAKSILRRINVHYIYLVKVFNKYGILPLIPLVIVSAASLIRELFTFFFKAIRSLYTTKPLTP